MKKRQLRNGFLLFLAASIWGMAFVAQSVAADHIGPFTFNAIRCILGGFILIPVSLLLQKNKTFPVRSGQSSLRHTLTGGLVCGLCLFAGSMLQQYGIAFTSVGKAGFITAFYIVLVPITGLFFHKKVRLIVWLSVLLALAGLYLLCMKEGFSVNQGDFCLLLGAFAFTGHILSIDHFVKSIDSVFLSMEQFWVCGILCSVFMLLFEKPALSQIMLAKIPLLYAGILSCGVAYTLQVVGQKDMNEAVASLILALESVVSALSGWIILHQALSAKELTGCALMFFAIALTCLPEKEENQSECSV